MTTAATPPDSLYLLDKEEFWDVARKIKPGLQREEYERMWEDFQQRKAEHERQQNLH